MRIISKSKFEITQASKFKTGNGFLMSAFRYLGEGGGVGSSGVSWENSCLCEAVQGSRVQQKGRQPGASHISPEKRKGIPQLCVSHGQIQIQTQNLAPFLLFLQQSLPKWRRGGMRGLPGAQCSQAQCEGSGRAHPRDP